MESRVGRRAGPLPASNLSGDKYRRAAADRGGPRPRRTRWPRALAALEVPGFRNLWFGTQFMMSGMHIQMMARSFLVYDITGSGKILAIVSAAQIAPVLALSPFGGVIADRVERRLLVLVFQAITAVIALLVAVSITTETVTWPYLMVAAMIYGVTFSFAMPARHALVPGLVGPERITNAVAIHAAGTSTLALLAPAVGGILYATIGPDGAYYVGFGMGVAALVFTSLIPGGVGKVAPSGAPMMADIKAGLTYVRRNEPLVAVMTMVVVTLLLVQALPFLLPIVVVEVYQRDSGSFGLLLSALGLGGLVGAIAIVMAKRWRPGLVLIGGALIAGLAMVAMAVFPVYLAGLVLLVGVGLSDAARRTLSNAIIMEQVDDAYLGRVMSVFYMATGLLPASLLVSGLAIDSLGSQITIGSMGVLLVLYSLAMLLTQKGLRELR